MTITITRDDNNVRTADLTHGISVEQVRHRGSEPWQPARVLLPLPKALSAEEARAFAVAVLVAANLAEQWTQVRSAEPALASPGSS
jgi:hypothetical protein